MRIAYTTIFDARDIHQWSGIPYHMSNACKEIDIQVDYIGSLTQKLPPFFKAKQIWKKWIAHQHDSPRFHPVVIKNYAKQVTQQLKSLSVDAILAPLINPIAYLDCKQPIVLWTDALYAALLGFYSPSSHRSSRSSLEINRTTFECLSRTSLAIFSSDWAARSALELYGINKEKVKVVPFGANIDSYPNYSDIQTIIKNRSHHTIKLLFLAKEWERKGGEVVLAVTKALHDAGHSVELTLIGCTPKNLNPIPAYIQPLGFISKFNLEGKLKIQNLLKESHFLFVPSRAEAYGIVFCEANAFGMPCLTTYVGGIGTIVKDHLNGMTFALDASIQTYCDYIVNMMQDRKRYEALALSSYNEFITRLNWKVATEQVKKMIEEII